MNTRWIETYRDELIGRYPALASRGDEFFRAALTLTEAYRRGNKLLVCGNGGSAADADHIVGELMKSFVVQRPLPEDVRDRIIRTDGEQGPRIAASLQIGYPAIALTQHTALISAYANDADPVLAYAQQVLGYGREGDVFLGISTSGNSPNVVAAAITAKALGLKVIGLTGAGGGKLRSYCDVCVDVPERETYKAQELHLPVYHALCLAVEKTLENTTWTPKP
jgi:D-sedoheptulose 7-phosphate isomerase